MNKGEKIMKKISVVVPCYNEEDIIEEFYKEVKNTFKLIENYKYEIIFVDDGSKDNTVKIIKNIKQKDSNIKIISFSRNFGKESAMYAGLENAKGDLVVVMDADLQHPPKKIIEMLNGIEERL